MHNLQNWIVALLVPGCTVYAMWKLMPAAARRSLASSLVRMPHLPAPLSSGLRRAAQRGSGCGCDGCDHAPAKSAANPARPISFHPRARR